MRCSNCLVEGVPLDHCGPFAATSVRTNTRLLADSVRILDAYVEVAPEFSSLKVQAVRWLEEAMTTLKEQAEKVGNWNYVLHNPKVYIDRYLSKEKQNGS